MPVEQESNISNTETPYTNEKEAQFAQITFLQTRPELEGNTLLYGKLQITLPDGVTIEEQTAEQNKCVIDLVGAEHAPNKPLPPRIWLAGYHAIYQNEYDLASALLDILPDLSPSTPLRIRYKTDDNRHYLFTYENLCKQGYILVYEGNLYIMEELGIEQSYSLGALFDENAISWKDSACEIGNRYSEEWNTVYNKIQADEDTCFLATQSVDENNMQSVSLFRDGYFTSPESIFTDILGNVEFKDYNFDSCPDMIMTSPMLVYLWNPDKKAYEQVRKPKDFPRSLWKTKCYPETKTIHAREYDDEKNKEENWDCYYRTETLWQWEENTLIKKRECIVEKSDEDVRIAAYESNVKPKNILFDETVSISDWKENNAKVQTCYRKFYAGMTPKENDDWLHPIDYNQKRKNYISQSLLDETAKAMLDDIAFETLSEYKTGRQLTIDEMAAISKNQLELRCDLLSGEQIKKYIMTMTDADNDGIEDIIVEKYYGNAQGFTDYCFYQGLKDGTYQKTSEYSSVKERFEVLSYDNKTYLCRIPYSNNLKRSITFVYYEDGIEAETAELFLAPKDYNVSLMECAENQYRTLAETVLENSVTCKEKIDAYKKIEGSAEEKSPTEQYQYQCDLNNDGVPEQYQKSISSGEWKYLHFSGKGAGIKYAFDVKSTVAGTPMMLWVESFDGKNIINIISVTELDNFEITGFLVNDKAYKKLYQITAKADYEVQSKEE